MKSPYLKLIHVLKDECSGEYELLLEFETIGGQKESISVRRDEFDASLHKRLRKLGANISPNFEAMKSRYSAVLATEHTVPSLVRAPRTGWRPSGAFVLPTRVVGKHRERSLMPPRLSKVAAQWPLPTRGSLDAWKRAIEDTKSSSLLMFCAALPFAAATLRHSGRPSFGFLLYGKSKRGKSTATLVCSSAIGIGAESNLPNFNATDAALGELPAIFNDLPTPINELGASTAKGAGLSHFLENFSYKVGESTTRQYSSFASVTMDTSASVQRDLHTILLASSEKSARDIAQSANHSRAQGATIRLCDLPIMDDGMDDIFDLCPLSKDRVTRSKRRLGAIREGVKTAHGRPIREFTRSFQRSEEASLKTLDAERERFVGKMSAEDDTPEVDHVLDNFALIYAAGALAVSFGILPYSKKQLRIAVGVCFKRAKKIIPSDANLVREGLSALKRAVKDGHFEDDDFGEGFFDESKSPRKLIIRVESLRALLPYPMQASLTLAELHAQGRLPSARPIPRHLKDSIQWACSQPTWPNGKRIRSVEILAERKKGGKRD